MNSVLYPLTGYTVLYLSDELVLVHVMDSCQPAQQVLALTGCPWTGVLRRHYDNHPGAGNALFCAAPISAPAWYPSLCRASLCLMLELSYRLVLQTFPNP